MSLDVDGDIATFMAESLSKWTVFVAQIQDSDTVTVIEASFFNNLIESLFTHRLDQRTILDFGLKLQSVIEPVKPALVYLTHYDITTALEENFQNRGSGFQDFVIKYVSDTPIAREKNWNDYDGMLAFWKQFVGITDSLYHAFEVDKLMLDVSRSDWEGYHRRVTDFLSLSLVADPEISPEGAGKFVGYYRFQDGGKEKMIQYSNGTLFSDIFMNVTTKLIPVNESSFIVEKWHFELNFDFDYAGEVTSFEIGGRDVSYLKAVGLKAAKVKPGRQ